MEDKSHLILTPNQILYRVSFAMGFSMLLIVGLFALAGETTPAIDGELLAIDS